MTENRGRRARSGQLGLQSQAAENYCSPLRQKEGIVQMDEMSLEQCQGAVEIQPQQQMQKGECSMCLPYTLFLQGHSKS